MVTSMEIPVADKRTAGLRIIPKLGFKKNYTARYYKRPLTFPKGTVNLTQSGKYMRRLFRMTIVLAPRLTESRDM